MAVGVVVGTQGWNLVCRRTEVFSFSEIHISFSSPGMSRGWASIVVKPQAPLIHQKVLGSSGRLIIVAGPRHEPLNAGEPRD